MEDAGAPLDDRDAIQEGKHGEIPFLRMGLGREAGQRLSIKDTTIDHLLNLTHISENIVHRSLLSHQQAGLAAQRISYGGGANK